MSQPTLPEVALAAINARFALIHEGMSPRELLDAFAPDQLVVAVGEGRRRGLTEFTLGLHTSAAFASWADMTAREAQGLRALWNDADGRERGIIVEGLKAGLSDEAALGATIGSVFGPLGMTVGAVLGGMYAGSKLDDDLGRSVQAYLVAVDAWYDASIERYNASVPAAAAQDEASFPSPAAADSEPLGCIGWGLLAGLGLGLLALLGGLGYGAYCLYAWIVEPSTDGVVMVPTPPDAAAVPPAALETSWTGDDGVSYTLERQGPNLTFLVADEAATQGRYRAGDTVFVLTEDSSGAYLVSHAVRPQPPAGATYQEAAFSDCARTVTTIDGTPLRGRRAHEGFELDIAVVELPARGFRRGVRRTQIIGCHGLGEATPFRRTIRLTSSPR